MNKSFSDFHSKRTEKISSSINSLPGEMSGVEKMSGVEQMSGVKKI